MGSVKFDVFISLERPSFAPILEEAKLSESLGYEGVWVADHVLGMYEEPGKPRYECWTASTALMAGTSKIRIGQLVLCNPFRHPPLLAKMAASLDSLGGGRLTLGLGTGFHEGEFGAYGYPFESPEARVRRLDEAAGIIKAMWTKEAPSFEGKYYRIDKAYCSPKPIQKPHPPLMIAGAGEQFTLRTVARHADISNYAAWTGTPDDFKAKSKNLDRHCERVGREPGEITRSWAAYCFIGEDSKSPELSVERYMQRMQARYGASGGRRPTLCGTPEQVTEQIGRYIDAGVGLFIIRFMGDDFAREAALFAEEVVPNFS